MSKIVIVAYEEGYGMLEHIEVNGTRFEKQNPCYRLLEALLDGRNKIEFDAKHFKGSWENYEEVEND